MLLCLRCYWLIYCTISINSSVTCHSRFWLTTAIKFSQFERFVGQIKKSRGDESIEIVQLEVALCDNSSNEETGGVAGTFVSHIILLVETESSGIGANDIDQAFDMRLDSNI
jgi:hypothetical protein